MAEDKQAETQEQPADIVELLQWVVGVLAGSAWQNLGLVPDSVTKKLDRNLDHARLAIDAVASLIDHLRPRVDDAKRRELETLLANLRLNFVEQKSKAEPAG